MQTSRLWLASTTALSVLSAQETARPCEQERESPPFTEPLPCLTQLDPLISCTSGHMFQRGPAGRECYLKGMAGMCSGTSLARCQPLVRIPEGDKGKTVLITTTRHNESLSLCATFRPLYNVLLMTSCRTSWAVGHSPNWMTSWFTFTPGTITSSMSGLSSRDCLLTSCSVSWRNALSTSAPPCSWALLSLPRVWLWTPRSLRLCETDPYPGCLSSSSSSWGLSILLLLLGLQLSWTTSNGLHQNLQPTFHSYSQSYQRLPQSLLCFYLLPHPYATWSFIF